MRCAICKFGVPTECQTAYSNFCFENVVENFKMLKGLATQMLGRTQVTQVTIQVKKTAGFPFKILPASGILRDDH
jgi:hypothetical protein